MSNKRKTGDSEYSDLANKGLFVFWVLLKYSKCQKIQYSTTIEIGGFDRQHKIIRIKRLEIYYNFEFNEKRFRYCINAE